MENLDVLFVIELKHYAYKKVWTMNTKCYADYTAEELFEKVPNARTFPQIFVDEESIGGYTDLEKLYG